MPLPCSVCSHPDRPEIDEQLVAGRPSQRSLAATYGVDRGAVARHKEKHLSAALKAVMTRKANAGSRRAVDRLEGLYDRIEALLSRAEDAPLRDQAALISQLRATLETLAKVYGELDERPQIAVVNVTTSAEWLRIRSALFSTLTAYPEAAQAVSARLKELE